MEPDDAMSVDEGMQGDMEEVDVPERVKKAKPRWPIKKRYREAVMTHLAMIGIDRNSAPTAVCNVAKVLLAAEVQNQKDEARLDANGDEKIQLFEDDNWYGNKADVEAALAIAEEKRKKCGSGNAE